MSKPCVYCNGAGKIGGCQKCGKVKSVGGEEKSEAQLKAETGEAFLAEPKVTFSGAMLKFHKISATRQDMLDKYAEGLDKTIDMANLGIVPKRSLLIASPHGFGKTLFLRAMRYALLRQSKRVCRIKTLEEFNINYSNLALGKDKALSFLEDVIQSDIIIVSVLNPQSTSLKSSIRNLLNFAEEYDLPAVITVSASAQSVLDDMSILHEQSLAFRSPILITYAE